MNQMRGLWFSVMIFVILTASSAIAADSACKFLGEANARIYALPTHMYMTETTAYTGGKTRTSELIYFNDATYIQVGGKWSLSKATPQKMAEMQKEAQKDESKMTCRVVRGELINGKASTLYSTYKQTPDVKNDSQIWISKSKGVPVKIEMDMDAGGADGDSHRSIRYEYTNVHAPAVN
jgi:hypothetical protein